MQVINAQPALFRSWDPEMKKFRELVCITYERDRLVSVTFRDGTIFIDESNPTAVPLDQQIGIDDYERQPIYRNDIVLTPYGHIRVINFLNGTYYAVAPDGSNATQVQLWTMQKNALPLKVGNIYENPEMLVKGYKYDYTKNRKCLKCEDGQYIRYRNRSTNEVKHVCDKCGDTIVDPA